jgi:hypothetical protein
MGSTNKTNSTNETIRVINHLDTMFMYFDDYAHSYYDYESDTVFIVLKTNKNIKKIKDIIQRWHKHNTIYGIKVDVTVNKSEKTKTEKSTTKLTKMKGVYRLFSNKKTILKNAPSVPSIPEPDLVV